MHVFGRMSDSLSLRSSDISVIAQIQTLWDQTPSGSATFAILTKIHQDPTKEEPFPLSITPLLLVGIGRTSSQRCINGRGEGEQ